MEVNDLVSRQDAVKAICAHLPYVSEKRAEIILRELPSAQPTEASCWGCNCPKMERLKEQKTFSEMVHLHDAETHEERTETHACDLISRQAAIDALHMHLMYRMGTDSNKKRLDDWINSLPSAQSEITRCGECTHKDKKIDYCHRLGRTICGRDYCSYAERRTDG